MQLRKPAGYYPAGYYPAVNILRILNYLEQRTWLLLLSNLSPLTHLSITGKTDVASCCETTAFSVLAATKRCRCTLPHTVPMILTDDSFLQLPKGNKRKAINHWHGVNDDPSATIKACPSVHKVPGLKEGRHQNLNPKQKKDLNDANLNPA